MTSYFCDTSAFAKRYVTETGSVWIRSWFEPPQQTAVFISQISLVEFFSLVSRRQREANIPLPIAVKAKNDFLLHAAQQYHTISVSMNVLFNARQLVERHAIRSLDAIQLASAITARWVFESDLTFISADQKLLAAAQAEGFSVDDPNAHP